ncbi:integrator complex subunit 3-like, partial [Plectropomus leopardus]|uniref:integrator complex subunit 3-like n=1 Tax=Plectropomus leopardus TaxID=160734 RepID=UPI001C4D7904
MMLYESFAQATALGDLHTCLMMDMKACQEDDVRLLCYLTPSIYSEFPDETLRSGELLNMIVAVIDSTQVTAPTHLSSPAQEPGGNSAEKSWTLQRPSSRPLKVLDKYTLKVLEKTWNLVSQT